MTTTKAATWLFSFLLAIPLFAQSDSDDSYSDGIYGYTSLDYDSTTNTMTAFSETDIDSSLQPYYSPEITMNMADNKGNNYSKSCSQTGPYTEYVYVTCQFTPGSGTQYTADGSHWALLNVYCSNGCGGEGNCWVDWGNFQYLEGENGTFWLGQDWFAPGPIGDNPDMESDIVMGGTMDQATLTASPHCGDARDVLINEYTSYLTDKLGKRWRTVFSPQCGDFAYWPTWNAAYNAGLHHFAQGIWRLVRPPHTGSSVSCRRT